MCISDLSSDVCSSDLQQALDDREQPAGVDGAEVHHIRLELDAPPHDLIEIVGNGTTPADLLPRVQEAQRFTIKPDLEKRCVRPALAEGLLEIGRAHV